ncbi:hypothetical protein C8J57DRAFT_1486745 [Mycena rebaudengoi]|nr:hypothetical protein C8J57DRAFT_1486745 [Mycena rebaudengoi]
MGLCAGRRESRPTATIKRAREVLRLGMHLRGVAYVHGIVESGESDHVNHDGTNYSRGWGEWGWSEIRTGMEGCSIKRVDLRVEREVCQAMERTQARPGGVVEGREAVVQELQGAHKGEGREARRVDGAVAREVMHGAGEGEFLRVPRMNSARDEQQSGDVLVVDNRSGLEYCAFQLYGENDPSKFHEGL